MKLPDNEPLEADDYWTVTDTWKQEWEKGVQVGSYWEYVAIVIKCNKYLGSRQAQWSS